VHNFPVNNSTARLDQQKRVPNRTGCQIHADNSFDYHAWKCWNSSCYVTELANNQKLWNVTIAIYTDLWQKSFHKRLPSVMYVVVIINT